MQLRSKLTILFTIVVSLILFVCFLTIYLVSSIYRQHEFLTRLNDKAYTTAELMIKVKQIDSALLKIIDKTNKDILYNESISVFDPGDTEIYTNNDSIRFDNSRELLREIRNKGSVEFRKGKFEGIGLSITDENRSYVVVAAAIDKYGFLKLRNLRNTLISMYFIVVIIIGAAGWFYSGRALKPIINITDEVNGIFPTDLSKRVASGNSKDELTRLADTFNSLLNRIENAFKAQKIFVANVSHELKNPLTAITSQLEVAMMKDRDSEEYRKTLASVLDDIRDLNKTSNQLLELARLDSQSPDIKMGPVRMDEVLWEARENVQRQNTEYKVELQLNLPEEEDQLLVKGNATLLRSCFVNLIENGCKFSGKPVEVTLSTGSENVTVTIKDNGPGIPDEDLPSLYDPFFRSKKLPQKKGHGIGLSIVKRVMDLHEAEINVKSSSAAGTVFIIYLKR